MKRFLFRIAIIAQVTGVLSCRERATHEEEIIGFVDDPLEYVNPFLGSAPLLNEDIIGYKPPEGWRVWAGLTFPGASLPNAMVQLGPVTSYGTGSGYQYEDNEILGLVHTNKGHWNLCNIPVLPVSNQAGYPFKSTFQKKDEEASPGFYQVRLDDYGVNVRLTSTLRSGFHKYLFDDASDRRILLDLGRANNRVRQWDFTQENDTEISGFQDVGNDQIYFYAILSDTIRSADIVRNDSLGYVILDLEGGKRAIDFKIGLSFVSSDNARENLKTELGQKSFRQVHEEARSIWLNELNKIRIAGGTEKEQMLFYSSLYRSLLWPALRSDTDGSFVDDDGNVHQADFNYYTKPSLWDTYRNKLVLLGWLRPEVTGDIIQSLVVRGKNNGFMPTFFHGDHAAPFVAGAYQMGITNFDHRRAYELLRNNAFKPGGTRPHIVEYIQKGYVPEMDLSDPVVETVGTAGVSKTLEYAYDDYALAKFAKKLGEDSTAEELFARSKNYINVFDTSSLFMRGRLADGSWVEPFDPEYPYYEYMYREANAWQLSFYVPHDMVNLVNLYGKENFERKLDTFFTKPWNKRHIARNVSGFIGQYSHGNQPDHEAPFAYYFVDQPAKSQKIIDRILRDYYGVGPEGLALCGMDDAGEMSAWYVFAALGLYPLSPADNEFVISVPRFEHSLVQLSRGVPLSIVKDTSASRRMDKVLLNDTLQPTYFINGEQLIEGGKLEIRTEKEAFVSG